MVLIDFFKEEIKGDLYFRGVFIVKRVLLIKNVCFGGLFSLKRFFLF